MDILVRDRPLRRAAWGASQGAVVGGALYLVAQFGLLSGRVSWLEALPFLLVGACICAAGQWIARGVLGACAGLVGGALLGSVLGDEMTARPNLARYHLHQPASLSGITLAGTRYNLAGRPGKVVLVAFWAPWRSRCRREMAQLKQLYERHHPDGLDIVGVSMETTREELSAVVENEELAWPQILPEGRGEGGWENPALFHQLANSIPYIWVVDQRGTIVAAGLTGARLEEAVVSVLAGQAPPAPVPTGFEEPWTFFVAAFGGLGGMLVERRLRQIARRPVSIPG